VIVTELSTEDIVIRVDELLEARYRSADLGNLDDPLAEAIFILISQQTRDPVYRRVFAQLRKSFPSWNDARHASLSALELILRPAGFQRRRASQLKALLEAVDAADSERCIGPYADPPADLSLDFLRTYSDRDAENFLTTLSGIGPKSARCILAYSLERPAFPVDTHVHRIIERLHLSPAQGRKMDHDPFQEIVPREVRKRLHINLVHHGRAVCRSTREKCDECVLISFCERGRTTARDSDAKPVAVDLFAGAGGLGRGFSDAGFRIGLAVEPERAAAQTYRFNHPGVPVIEAKITARTRAAHIRRYLPAGATVHALLAGTPCQGYSVAGARRPEHPKNRLYQHVARLAGQLKVEFVVLENVPGVRSVMGHRFLEPIVSTLEGAGFAVRGHLLRASDYGVPQRRLRYFFIGRRDRRRRPPTMPPPTHRRHGTLDDSRYELPETPTVTDVLSQIPALTAGTSAERLITSDGEFLNMSTMNHSQAVIDKISMIGPGEGPISYRRLDYTEAQTLVAGHRALPVHPDLDRTISVREAALVQGFPLDYFFCGSPTHQPLQVANAVPPLLAEAVARHLLKTENERG
jgi:DNA (cytosine-5)-methyltransferase 1